MLMEGTILRDTVSRNLSNKLGYELDSYKEGEKIQINDMVHQPDGTWYYINASGWINGRDINIDRDIEFLFKANSMGLMDLQLFAFGGLGSNLMSVIPNGGGDFVSSGKSSSVLGSIFSRSTGGGCFGTGGSSKSLPAGVFGDGGCFGQPSNSKNTKNVTIGGLLGGFGMNIGGGIFGSALGGLSLNSLSDGSFLESLLGSIMDSMFDAIFSRLNYVVGFDISSLLSALFAPFDASSFMNGVDGYSGLLDEYAKGHEYRYIDYLADMYFKYLGCDGEMITRTFENLSWEQDAYYTTPTLEPHQIDSEVSFNQDMFNADYSEFDEAVDSTRQALNLTIERLDWFVNFNRYRITHPDYHLTNSRAYIFMTRPDLNIFDETDSAMNESIKNTGDAAFFYEAVLRHSNIAMSLTTSFSGAHDFIPLVSNTARSLDVQDMSIKTLEHGETLTGWKLVYGRHDIDSLTAGTFSMNYIDDNMLSVSYMHLIWLTYINGVARGLYSPKQDYVRNGILDYASSLYYFLTDATGENIIFWTKYYGVFPTNYPSSAFSFNEGSPVHVPEIQIQYSYAFKKDMDPLELAEFNRNSPQNFSYVPVYNEDTFRCNRTISGPPFIDTEDGGITYKLRFREADS